MPAAATSGDYMQLLGADLRHHPIIEPRTGCASLELASVEQSRALLAQLPNLGADLVAKDGSVVEV